MLLTTNDGTTLLGANCQDTYYGSDIGGWSLFCVVGSGRRSARILVSDRRASGGWRSRTPVTTWNGSR